MTSILFLMEEIYCNIFQMQLSQEQKTFSQFFFAFWNLDSILNMLKKKMTLRAHVFLILRILKNMVR